MIRAIHFPDSHAFRQTRLRGSLHFTDPGDEGIAHMWFFCPCGCGVLAKIVVGNKFRPFVPGASWSWNGDRDNAALRGVVHHRDCTWRGRLALGYWEGS